jgi:hypothetical protein
MLWIASALLMACGSDVSTARSGVPLGGAVAMFKAGVWQTQGANAVLMASAYDQSCDRDSDCVSVPEGDLWGDASPCVRSASSIDARRRRCTCRS